MLIGNIGTSEVAMYQIPDTNVYLMDTPGFDDTYISDAEILKNIATALLDAFNDKVAIQGALYIHPVTEVRMKGSGRKNLIMFHKVLGTRGLAHCRLVTSKWSTQAQSVSVARERELCEKKEFWQPLLAAGAKTVRFGDSMGSAINIIKPLLQGSAFRPLLLKEIDEDHKTIEETQAGIVVLDDIEKARKIHLAEIADLKASGERERGEMRESMLAEAEEYQEAIQQLERSKKVLEQQVQSKSSGRFGRWIARGCAWVGGGAMTIVSGGIFALAAAALIAGTEAGAQLHKHL
jgi:hypothetical protein